MKKLYFSTVSVLVLMLLSAFYWVELRPYFGKKECYNRAVYFRESAIKFDNNMDGRGLLTKRADYEKVFKDNYEACLLQNALR